MAKKGIEEYGGKEKYASKSSMKKRSCKKINYGNNTIWH